MRSQVAGGLLVLACSAATAVVLVDAPSRVVWAATVTATAIALVAAVTRWSWTGTLATAFVPVVATAAEMLGDGSISSWRMLAAAGLLLVAITALDHLEEASWEVPALIARVPWPQRLAPSAVALVGAALIAVVAAQNVVPSMSLALLGLAAAVGAVMLATHRHGPGPPAS
jgi:hypothetical protein